MNRSGRRGAARHGRGVLPRALRAAQPALCPADRPARLARDEAAVADVVGSVLLVGITVLMMVALGFLIFNMQGPSDSVHADVVPLLRPGTDGQWGTGDESVVLEHRGGEPLPADTTTVRLRIDGALVQVAGDSLGDGFSDGRLTMGERWTYPVFLALDTPVDVDVVNTGAATGIVATGRLSAPSVQPAGCLPDTLAPSALDWTKTPTDLLSTTLTSVQADVQVVDDCAGVNETRAPTLHWRIVGTTTPTFTDAGAMSFQGPAGSGIWRGTIPVPTLGWSSVVDGTLEFYASGLTDLAGNVGNSSVESEAIQLAGSTTTYVSSSTWAVKGTVSNIANAQSATDSGAAARLTEGAGTTTSTTSAFSASSTVASSGWTNPGNGFASDNQSATASGNSPSSLRYALADPSGLSDTITSVVLKAEVRADKTSSEWHLQPCLTACGTESGNLGSPTTDTVLSYDVTSLRPGGGSWSWSDIQSLEVVVRAAGTGNPTYSVDHVHVEVVSGGTVRVMEIHLNVTGLPSNATAHTLSVRHASAGDTFDLEVRTVASPVEVWTDAIFLDATSATTSTYAIPLSAVVGNAVRLRVVDDTSGTTTGTVDLDWVRVVST